MTLWYVVQVVVETGLLAVVGYYAARWALEVLTAPDE